MQLSKLEAAHSPAAIDRSLTLEIVRVTERGAIAAAAWRGKGDERAADLAAVDAMIAELRRIEFSGRIVIGEGERDEVENFFIGQQVGAGGELEVDIAVDPLEGVTLCAKNQPDSICVMALAERGGLLNVARNVYMHKIAIGPGYPADLVNIDAKAGDNCNALAKAKGVPLSEITACVLDRPRHAGLINELRDLGVGVKLISDGDIAGVIHAAQTDDTGIDIYLGSGGAPEGVLAAAALRCTGGQMQGKLILDSHEKRERAEKMGISDPYRIYGTTELASGDVLFAATGVTDGNMLDGVKLKRNAIVTSTIVMRSWSRTIRRITAEHAR
jgi:fructose-1,6-bisphosphatase II / sedoheptulose-1,7-bisphosphatase